MTGRSARRVGIGGGEGALSGQASRECPSLTRIPAVLVGLTFASVESPSSLIKMWLLQGDWIEVEKAGQGHQLMSQETKAG